MEWQGLDLHGFLQMTWQGLDLHGFSCLLSQGSLILSMFINFNDMIKAQYRVDVPSACTTAWHPHPHAVDELTSCEQKT